MLVLGIIAGVMLIWLLYGFLSNYHLVTTTYSLTVDKPIGEHTFVHLSDLHCCRHGKVNQRLLDRIDKASPEAILITGDMVTKHLPNDGEKVQSVLRFLEALSKKYPVYYADGNHEIRLRDYDGYRAELSRFGIHLPSEGAYTYPDDRISLYGLELPIMWYRTSDRLSVEDMRTFLHKNAPDEGSISILLAHDPGYADAYSAWGADLTLSGHLHGGILRLPFVGGVFSPYLRLFPKYSGGMHETDGKHLIVSRGLGTHHVKFRWFNPPEVVVIKIRGV